MVSSGKGRNPVKGLRKRNGKNLGSDLKTDQGIVIIGMRGIIEIVRETEIETRRESVGVTVTVIVHVIATRAGTAGVTMTVTGSETVIAIVTGRGIEIVIMKLLMLIVVVLVIETMTMIRLNINMSETDRVTGKEKLIMWSKRRVIMAGMNNLNMDTSVQRVSMDTMITMIITKVRVNMIIQMFRLMTSAMKILIDIGIDMIIWKRTIMAMTVLHLNYKKKIVTTGVQRGRILANTITDNCYIWF